MWVPGNGGAGWKGATAICPNSIRDRDLATTNIPVAVLRGYPYLANWVFFVAYLELLRRISSGRMRYILYLSR